MRYHCKSQRLNNLFLGFHILRTPIEPKGISYRRNNLFWKRGYWQSCWLSLQSPEATQSISCGPKSLGPPWTQRASPAGEISLLEKGVPHCHVGYYCKAQKFNNMFSGVPRHMDTPWTQRASPAGEIRALEKSFLTALWGIIIKPKGWTIGFLGSHILLTPLDKPTEQ